MLHPRQVLLAVLSHHLGVRQGSVLEGEVDGGSDVLVAVVEVDENCAYYVVEGRLGELYVSAGEEELDRCSYLQTDGVLGIVEALEQQRVDILEFIITDRISE